MIKQYKTSDNSLTKIEYNKQEAGFASYIEAPVVSTFGIDTSLIHMVGEDTVTGIVSYYYKAPENTEENYLFSCVKVPSTNGGLHTKVYYKGKPELSEVYEPFLGGKEILAYGVISDLGVTTVFTAKDDDSIHEGNFTSNGMSYQGFTFDANLNLTKDVYYESTT